MKKLIVCMALLIALPVLANIWRFNNNGLIGTGTGSTNSADIVKLSILAGTTYIQSNNTITVTNWTGSSQGSSTTAGNGFTINTPGNYLIAYAISGCSSNNGLTNITPQFVATTNGLAMPETRSQATSFTNGNFVCVGASSPMLQVAAGTVFALTMPPNYAGTNSFAITNAVFWAWGQGGNGSTIFNIVSTNGVVLLPGIGIGFQDNGGGTDTINNTAIISNGISLVAETNIVLRDLGSGNIGIGVSGVVTNGYVVTASGNFTVNGSSSTVLTNGGSLTIAGGTTQITLETNGVVALQNTSTINFIGVGNAIILTNVNGVGNLIVSNLDTFGNGAGGGGGTTNYAIVCTGTTMPNLNNVTSSNITDNGGQAVACTIFVDKACDVEVIVSIPTQLDSASGRTSATYAINGTPTGVNATQTLSGNATTGMAGPVTWTAKVHLSSAGTETFTAQATIGSGGTLNYGNVSSSEPACISAQQLGK